MGTMRPSAIGNAGDALSGAGAGALVLAALADLGATCAGWPPLATRPGLAPIAACGAALVAAGAIGAVARARSAVAAAGALTAALRTTWTAREAACALALVALAFAFCTGLALDVRPRRVWALSAATLSLACITMACAARARPAGLPVARVLAGLAAGAVIVEAMVRPASGVSWAASAGLGLLVAALVADEALHRPAGGRGRLRAVALATGFALPALWLAAGLPERGAGLAAAIACVGGLAAIRVMDEPPGAGAVRSA